jgi:hypothetical protein
MCDTVIFTMEYTSIDVSNRHSCESSNLFWFFYTVIIVVGLCAGLGLFFWIITLY